MRLTEAAGWNQTETDWGILLHTAPEGCLGLDCAGNLVSTASAISFGRELGWIGMVLTHPEHRGRGFARRLLSAAVDHLDTRGVGWLKLDATDMGRPLYRQFGFEDQCAVERWGRPASSESRIAPMMSAFAIQDWLALDREAFGADRAHLIRQLAPLGAAAVPGQAYAVHRDGRRAAYFGPCVRRSFDAVRTLLSWVLAQRPNQAVYWDLLPSNRDAVRLAREFGFAPLRQLVRMARPGRDPLSSDDSKMFAIAGFEYG
jgi:GNAT superfamily N-acetyltransferase